MPVQPLTPERFSARPIDGIGDLAPARAEFARWLEALGIDHQTADDLLVVVSELAANAVRESPADGRLPFVAATFAADSINVEVANEVDPIPHPAPKDSWDLDDPLRTGGRGLLVVSALVDDVDVEVQGRWLRVRCTVAIDDCQDDSTVT